MLETIFSWNTLWWILMPIYIAACIGLIAVVLLQKGKGTGFAGAFGVGPGSDTVFGPRARKSLPVRLTYIMAGLFMVLSLSLSLIVGRQTRGAAPEAVAEDTAVVSTDNALDQLFGDSTSVPATDGTISLTPSPEPPAPAATVETAPEPGATTPAAPAETAPEPGVTTPAAPAETTPEPGATAPAAPAPTEQ